MKIPTVRYNVLKHVDVPIHYHTLKKVLAFLAVLIAVYILYTKREEHIRKQYVLEWEEFLSNIKQNYLSIEGNGGRVGNQIFTLASGWGIAKKLNRTFYISKNSDERFSIERQRSITEKIFPKLKNLYVYMKPPASMETAVEHDYQNGKQCCCTYEDPLKHRNEKSKFLLLKTKFTQNMLNFFDSMDEFKTYLEFSSDIKSFGQAYIKKNHINASDHIACVHIRKTDFVGLNRNVPDDVLEALIEYFMSKNNHNRLLFFGDDRNFMNTLLERLKNNKNLAIASDSLVSENESGVDLYLASEVCTAFLITHPATTFGFWSAFLTKNWKDVYYYYIPNQEITLYKKGFPLPWNPIGYQNKLVAPIELTP